MRRNRREKEQVRRKSHGVQVGEGEAAEVEHEREAALLRDAGRCGEVWGDVGRCGEMVEHERQAALLVKVRARVKARVKARVRVQD